MRMYPFKVRFSRTLIIEIKPNQINSLLDIAQEILQDKGVMHFSKDINCPKFKNYFFNIIGNWKLMALIDAGFIEIKEIENNKIKIRYGITLINLWIITIIAAIIMYFSSNNDIIFALTIFGFMCLMNWLIILWRHINLFLKFLEKI